MSAAGAPDEGASAEGAWLELSVTADPEAVEAVSEILSRYAPGGTTVEPAFELVDEGLGARIDPDRPAIVRAYLPGSRRGSGTDRGGRRRDGPRPPDRLRVAADRGARDAGRPRGGLGPRLEGTLPGPPGRATAGHPADLAAAPPGTRRRRPGPRSGDGLRDRSPPDDEAVPGGDRGLGRPRAAGRRFGARAAEPRPRRRLRLGHPGDRGGAVRCRASWSASTPIRSPIEATEANARRNRLGRRLTARQGSLPSGDPPFDLVLANLIASVLIGAGRRARGRARPDGSAARVGDLRRPRGRGPARVRGRRSRGRRSDGRWRVGRARGGPRRLTSGRRCRRDPVVPVRSRHPATERPFRRAPVQSGPCPRSSRSSCRSTSPWRSPCSCLRCCCRSRSGPIARRPSRRAGSSGSCSGCRARGSIVIGIGLIVTGAYLIYALGTPGRRPALADRRARDLCDQPGPGVLHPAPEPARAGRACATTWDDQTWKAAAAASATCRTRWPA